MILAVEDATSDPDREMEDGEMVPVTLMSLGMSESVNPDTPLILMFFRVTPSRESIFWVRVIICMEDSVLPETLPTLEDTEEREERREARESLNSFLTLSLREERDERRSLRTEERSAGMTCSRTTMD